jgi:hypothetical protein
MMMPSPASLLALASALDAQGDALKAQAASIRAAIESGAQAPAPDVVNIEAATALLGSKRRARETFAAFEREGFEVHRLGHAVFMQRGEWDRAIASRNSKRDPLAAHTNSTDADAESVDAIFARAGFTATRTPQRGQRKRAAGKAPVFSLALPPRESEREDRRRIPMESLRRTASKRKRAAKQRRATSAVSAPKRAPVERTPTERAPVERSRGELAALVPGAPRGLRFTGDVAALDTLDVHELVRIARRVGR